MNIVRLFLTSKSLVISSRLRLGGLPFIRHGFSRMLVVKHAFKTNAFHSWGHFPRNLIHPDDRTIFVGKINPTTTEETLKKQLSDYGDIEDVKVIKTIKTCSAYVVFKDMSSVTDVLQRPDHVIDMKSVRVEKYKRHQAREKKIHVAMNSSLESELSEKDIRTHFSQFGNVESVDFVYDSETRKRKNFCFVAFSSEEDVVKALESETQQIGAHSIEVHKSTAKGRDFVPGKIMLEDLPHDVTAEDIQEYFQTFGNLSHIDMIFYRAGGEPRDFAFVTFNDSMTVDQLTKEENVHMIGGRTVYLHRAVSTFQARDRDLKVFIENVCPHTDLKRIKTYFGTFGGVDQIHLVESWMEKHDNQCGIVKFANSAGVTKAMSCPEHVLDGSVIRVRRLGLTGRHKTYLPISSFFSKK